LLARFVKLLNDGSVLWALAIDPVVSVDMFVVHDVVRKHIHVNGLKRQSGLRTDLRKELKKEADVIRKLRGRCKGKAIKGKAGTKVKPSRRGDRLEEEKLRQVIAETAKEGGNLFFSHSIFSAWFLHSFTPSTGGRIVIETE
jgi:hypothetical protein